MGHQKFPIKTKIDAFREYKEAEYKIWKENFVDKSTQEIKKEYKQKIEQLDISNSG
jgi:hypothetical protein